MFVASFPAGPWQTNCYLVALAPGTDQTPAPCVVIDPGVDAGPTIEQLLTEHRLAPSAVLLTHGHIDHMAGAADFADPRGLRVHCAAADEPLLSEPGLGLSDQGREWVRGRYGSDLIDPPSRVAELAGSGRLDLAGLEFDLMAAPGHTPGCTLLRLPDTEHGPIVFTGDVVFAGSVGRTDLPGSDPAAMAHSLREVVWGLDDASHLLPGHGSLSTMAAERASNPYLRQARLGH